MTQKQIETVIDEEESQTRSYQTQNAKVWTINFSQFRHKQRAKLLIPSLMKRTGLWSMGVTILTAVEYCEQERVIKDFTSFVNSRKRSLLDK